MLLGGLFLLGQVVHFGRVIGAWGQPFFVMLPGIALLVLDFAGGKSAAGLAIPGSIVTTADLILFVQNPGDHSESWAYAWRLIDRRSGAGTVFARGLEGNPAVH